MMTARPGSVERRVEHQRHPGQRDPVAVIERAESPSEIFGGHAVADVGLFRDVQVVVDRNESIAADLQIDGKREATSSAAIPSR